MSGGVCGAAAGLVRVPLPLAGVRELAGDAGLGLRRVRFVLAYHWTTTDDPPVGRLGRLCQVDLLHLARGALERVRLSAGGRVLLDLDSVDDGRGRRIPAGEMLWAMAAHRASGWRGRLALDLLALQVAPGDLQLLLWIDQRPAGLAVEAVFERADGPAGSAGAAPRHGKPA